MRKMTMNMFWVLMLAMFMPAMAGTAQEEDEGSENAGDAGTPTATVSQARLVIELGAPFCDHAVLQRDMKLPVWGWSKPGTTITVEFCGQEKSAVAGADGKWMVRLDPLSASSKPAEMVIRDSEGKTVTLKDILVGEVWMASGQSNMQLKVEGTDVARLKVTDEAGVAPIREFEVTSAYAQLHPIEKATGAWKNGNYGDYSAIAFSFAHKLYTELDVPIGILNCSFSETSIQAWTPRVGFRDGKDAYTQAIYQKILKTDPTTPEHKAAWGRLYEDMEKAIQANDERAKRGEPLEEIPVKLPGNLNGNRDASWMFNGRMNPVVPYAIRGAIWNQGYASMQEGILYYNNLHSLIRGWRLVWDNPGLPVYFHQFYAQGPDYPSLGGVAEMRLGTWLARDIPNTGMASQIDIGGGVHYKTKLLPGQRLALHALKNQFPGTSLKKGGMASALVVDGPMFKSYTVDGNAVVVEFDHAEGGLIVAQNDPRNCIEPGVIADGEDRVKLFLLAGEDRVWHRATVKISGDKVIVTAPEVPQPRGIAYAVSSGASFRPNLYNKALLPMTPFMLFDHKLVTKDTWPEEQLKIANVPFDPAKSGLRYQMRKLPLLSTSFCDNAVFQAGVPVPVWGSTGVGMWYNPEGKAEIDFKAYVNVGVKGTAEPVSMVVHKKIQVHEGVPEWGVTLPPMPPSTNPITLHVTYAVDGEVVHERMVTNIVVGDVWYVAAPEMAMKLPQVPDSGQIVRVIGRGAKNSTTHTPRRFSVSISTTPASDNRFASIWTDAQKGFAYALGHRIAAKTGHPVGIVYMATNGSKGKRNPPIKGWIPVEDLVKAPSLITDYNILGSRYPWGPGYNDSMRQYLATLRRYWSETIPAMMATKAAPDGSSWGQIPGFQSIFPGQTEASLTYNVMTHSFTPMAMKGIILISSPEMTGPSDVASFGSELTVLANSLKDRFSLAEKVGPEAGNKMLFAYTMPSETLAPGITRPEGIRGKTLEVPITDWSDVTRLIESLMDVAY